MHKKQKAPRGAFCLSYAAYQLWTHPARISAVEFFIAAAARSRADVTIVPTRGFIAVSVSVSGSGSSIAWRGAIGVIAVVVGALGKRTADNRAGRKAGSRADPAAAVPASILHLVDSTDVSAAQRQRLRKRGR